MTKNNLELAGYRVLVTHAHPDDETLFTGGTIAGLSGRGAQVTVATATLGEEGEVIGDKYQHLVADEADQLGGFRIGELDAAVGHLGARSVLLGGPGQFRDSGMAGSAAHANPRALVNRAPEAAQLIAQLIDELRPDAVLTYGSDGGYGHPDHIAVHQATHQALKQAGWAVPRVWWAIYERELTLGALETLRPPEGWQLPSAEYLENFTNAGADLKVRLTPAAYQAKRHAMAAHATQIWLGDGTVTETNPEPAWVQAANPAEVPTGYALSNRLLMPLPRTESYQLAQGPSPLGEGIRGLLGELDS